MHRLRRWVWKPGFGDEIPAKIVRSARAVDRIIEKTRQYIGGALELRARVQTLAVAASSS